MTSRCPSAQNSQCFPNSFRRSLYNSLLPLTSDLIYTLPFLLTPLQLHWFSCSSDKSSTPLLPGLTFAVPSGDHSPDNHRAYSLMYLRLHIPGPLYKCQEPPPPSPIHPHPSRPCLMWQVLFSKNGHSNLHGPIALREPLLPSKGSLIFLFFNMDQS